MSNVLGTINPVATLADAAHAHGALAVVDACQYVPHLPTDVQAMGADFVAFSGHKMCGPTGIGVLWGREELLDAMPPFLGGGDMIADVRLDGFTPADLPVKFEAGTPPIAEAIGLGAAVDYLERARHGRTCGPTRWRSPAYALDRLTERFGDDITIHGPDNVEVRGGVVSFAFGDVHPHDISQVLDQTNVCVRAGHHCAKPLMRELGVGATARASLYVYNDIDDVDALVDALDARRRLLHALEGTPMPGLEDLYREIILDHYRNPRNRGELRHAAGPPGRGLQPAVRRRDRGLPRRRRRRRCSDIRIGGPGLLDQPELGVDDVGRGEGQDDRRGPGSCGRSRG